METLSHQYIEKLKKTHPALRLLNSDNAPLAISFFYRIFIQPNCRSIPYSEFHAKLADYLFSLQEVVGENKYPRTAKAYIEEWSSEHSEFLRQYYTTKTDEPEIDLTPAAEKALQWLISLEQKQFIGAESRLLTIFQLLREIVYETEQDPAVRLADLERQKRAVQDEIEKIQAGIASSHDTRLVKERFLQTEEAAHHLISDFRQVEYNFRQLDREARERIAKSDEQKGQLLDIIFREQDTLQDSDQGKSFKAFWEFLMSPNSQDELKKLLGTTFNLPEVKELQPSDFLEKIDLSLLTAGEKVYQSSTLLAEQLRKYLDNQAYLENRRILDIIKKIEKNAITLRSNLPKTKSFSAVNESTPDIHLTMSRSLFSAPSKIVLVTDDVKTGDATGIKLNKLYEQVYVDELELQNNIRKALASQTQISLKELLMQFPIKKGVEEVVAYLNIAAKSTSAVINEDIQESIELQTKKLQMAQVIFLRDAS